MPLILMILEKLNPPKWVWWIVFAVFATQQAISNTEGISFDRIT